MKDNVIWSAFLSDKLPHRHVETSMIAPPKIHLFMAFFKFLITVKLIEQYFILKYHFEKKPTKICL